MSRTIERAEREVQKTIDVVRRCAEPKADRTLAVAERALWSALLALGRAVMALLLARCAERPHAATYEHAGQRYAFDAKTRRKTDIGTRDAQPTDDGEILVIQVDGRGAPMITATEHERRRQPRQARSGTRRHGRRAQRRAHPRPRRKKGDKSKNAKVAFVGVIYTLHKTRDGMEGPINKRLVGTFESHEALFKWLYEHAKVRGYGKKRTVFLADGSDHIWRNKQAYFPGKPSAPTWKSAASRSRRNPSLRGLTMQTVSNYARLRDCKMGSAPKSTRR